MKGMPILIPAKGRSVRCPRKNEVLLPHVSIWLTAEERRRATVISDSRELLALAESLGLRGFYSAADYSELAAMAHWVKAHEGVEAVIHLPLTQPLRERGLIGKTEAAESAKAFVVSVSPYRDRTLFKVAEHGGGFAAPARERKGRHCADYRHVDGAIYRIKSDFLLRVAASDNPNAEFWAADFDTVENNMPFLDIDTPEDLEQLKNLIDLRVCANR